MRVRVPPPASTADRKPINLAPHSLVDEVSEPSASQLSIAIWCCIAIPIGRYGLYREYDFTTYLVLNALINAASTVHLHCGILHWSGVAQKEGAEADAQLTYRSRVWSFLALCSDDLRRSFSNLTARLGLDAERYCLSPGSGTI